MLSTRNIFAEKLKHVECLTGYEGNVFAFPGGVEKNLSSITAVHPVHRDAVEAFLQMAGSDWQPVIRLIKDMNLIEAEYRNNTFHLT